MNTESSRSNGASAADLAYQVSILPGVSRTFALTIPVLPEKLAEVITNAYLLCRLADTIEDDVGLDNQQKSYFHRRFVAVVRGDTPAEPFARELVPLLSSRALPAEKDLVENAAAVIRVTHTFSTAERAALTRCVSVMCSGMPEFQRKKSLRGLEDLDALGSYCYFVAGVVGEMCTELFCLHCPELAKRREDMMRLAVSFGQGLQMTNILKDIWDDRQAQACWLPRSVFAGGDFPLERLEELHLSETFRDGLNELIGIGHAHLRNALEYTASDSEARGGYPQVLPLGHRFGRAHATQDSSQPGLPLGHRGESVAALGEGHRFRDQSHVDQQSRAAFGFCAGSRRAAARAAGGRRSARIDVAPRRRRLDAV